MFNKIISNLAFSPSAIDQVSFYAKRLKKEQAIRRTGLVLIVLSMFIQVFAATVSPEKSVNASSNDVISGGATNLDQLKKKYNAHKDVKALYNRFGIDGNDMTSAGSDSVHFDFAFKGSQETFTVGRVNFASTNDHNLGQGKFEGTTFYSRNATEWAGSKDDAFYFGRHKGTDGKYYLVWVLKDCGNLAYREVDVVKKPDKPKKTPTAPQVPVTPPTAPPIDVPPPVTSVETPPTVTTETPPVETPPTVTTETPPVETPPTVTPPTTTPVCENNPSLKPDDILCKCVDNPEITADNPDCTTPAHKKTAQNITQKLSPEATLTTNAQANDVIEYTLTTANTNVVDKKNYVIEDYIGDVLDYANLDMNYLANQGGKYSAETKKVTWTNQTLPGKGEVIKTFRVTVKSVIPSTNSPNKSAPDFDCKMQNGYGTETVIPVNCSPMNSVESLPNTGPGTTVAIAFGVSVLSGYFFMRSRLLAKEVGIVKRIYQVGA